MRNLLKKFNLVFIVLIALTSLQGCMATQSIDPIDPNNPNDGGSQWSDELGPVFNTSNTWFYVKLTCSAETAKQYLQDKLAGLTDEKKAYQDANGNEIADMRRFSHPTQAPDPNKLTHEDYTKSALLLSVFVCDRNGLSYRNPASQNNPFAGSMAVEDLEDLIKRINDYKVNGMIVIPVKRDVIWYSKMVNPVDGVLPHDYQTSTNYTPDI